LATERSSFGRDVKESRQGGGNASVAAWPRLLGRESGQISTGPTHVDMGAHLFYIARLPMGATANRSISSSLKIPLGLLLTVPLAVCVYEIIVAHYHSHTLTALASTLGTKLVRRVHSDSTLQRVSTLPDPRLLPIQVLPDPVLTPGEARNISLAEVKKLRSGAARISNIPTDVKRAVFWAYGLSVDEKNYELDHLIPLSLGGSNSAKNLWPHSRKGSFWTVEKKLTLEKSVYRLVCAGHLSLVAARQEVASNWPKAYRKYIDKTAPILPERSLAKLSLSAAESSSKN